MKNIKILLAASLLTIACGLLTGCKTLDKAFFRETQWATNWVAEKTVEVRTNVVTIVQMTNSAGQVIGFTTNREPVVVPITIPAHQEIKPIAWEPNPAAKDTANMIGGLFGPYGALGATGVSTILAAIAAMRGRKYRDAAVSLAQGIQYAAEQFPDKAGALIEIQKQVQDESGTRGIVNSILDKHVTTKFVPRS